MRIPDRFRIGNAGLAQACAWHIKRDSGSILVRTAESYQGLGPNLVSAQLVASAAHHEQARFAKVARILAHGELAGLPPGITIPDSIASPRTREDTWAAFRLSILTATDVDLGPLLEQWFARIQPELPMSELWLVEASPTISMRATAARSLFAAEEQPELLQRPDAEFEGFPPSPELMRSLTVGLAAFVDPMVMTMSPWLIGMPVARRGGSLVLLFGQTEPGIIDSQAPELLNLLRPSWSAQAAKGTSCPTTTITQAAELVQYWSQRLNTVLSMALDPTRYADTAGYYSPRDHMGVLLSLERLFGSVQGVLAHADRDPYTRQLFFFSTMDQFVGLGIDSWSNLLSPRRAREHLSELEAILPPGVREILLWRCTAAVEALEALRDRLGPRERVKGNLLDVKTDRGGWDSVTLDEAVARYLNVLRDSTHSFREMAKRPRRFAMLASEKEGPANAIADLGLLHLLRFLERPVIRVSPLG